MCRLTHVWDHSQPCGLFLWRTALNELIPSPVGDAERQLWGDGMELMAQAKRSGTVWLVFAAALPLGLAAVVSAQAPAHGVVSGRVLELGSNRAVPGALVSLWRSTRDGIDMRKVLTTDSGQFVFVDLPPDRYDMSAVAAGFELSHFGQDGPGGAATSFALAPEQRSTDLILHLWKLAVLIGSVSDEHGAPVPGVAVEAWRREPDPRVFGVQRLFFQPNLVATTDDEGRYRIPVPPGSYTVVVPAAVDTTASPDGRDASAAGVSSPGAFLSSGPAHRPAAVPPPADSSGSWAYQATFLAAAASTTEATFVTARSGEGVPNLDLVLRLEKAYSLSGRLEGSAGIGSVRLRLVPTFAARLTPDTEFDVATTTTTADGEFHFRGVTPGRYVVRPARSSPLTSAGAVAQTGAGSLLVAPAGSIAANSVSLSFGSELEVQDHDLADLQLPVRRGVRVTGSVTSLGTGNPPSATELQRIGILLAPAEGGLSPTSTARPASDGSFQTADYALGRYFVTVTAIPTGWFLHSATVADVDVSTRPLNLTDGGVFEGLRITLTDKPTMLSGTVRDERDQPVANAVVMVFPARYRELATEGLSSRSTPRTSSSTNGVFSFRGVPEGEYLVVALPAEASTAWQSLDDLARLSAHAAHVTLHEGQPVAVDVRFQPLR